MAIRRIKPEDWHTVKAVDGARVQLSPGDEWVDTGAGVKLTINGGAGNPNQLKTGTRVLVSRGADGKVAALRT